MWQRMHDYEPYICSLQIAAYTPSQHCQHSNCNRTLVPSIHWSTLVHVLHNLCSLQPNGYHHACTKSLKGQNHFCSWYTKIPQNNCKSISQQFFWWLHTTVEDLLGDQLNTPWRVFLLYLPIFIFTNVSCSNIQIPSHLTPASFPGKHLWTPISVYCRRQFRRFVSYPWQLRLSRWYGPELSPK